MDYIDKLLSTNSTIEEIAKYAIDQNDNISKKTALVYDPIGLFTHIAIKLGSSFGRVKYFREWESGFPNSSHAVVGTGLDEIERVTNFLDHVDKSDIIIFTDVSHGDLQDWLRRKGYRVWGAGKGTYLELNRTKLKETLKQVGLPVIPTKVIRGMQNLVNYLKKHKDVWIKNSFYRGDFETFHHHDYYMSKPWLDNLAHKLGPKQDTFEFIIEEGVDGVESGYDGFTIDGKFSKNCFYGYECKDAAYIGRTSNSLPKPLEYVNQKLSPVFKELSYRGFYSNEVRLPKKKEPYVLDMTMRCGSPPSQTYMEIFSNWGEIIWYGSGGVVVEPKPTTKYGAQLMLKSGWSGDGNFLAVNIPKEYRNNVKLNNHCRMNGQDFVVPSDLGEYVGAVVGTGNTFKEAVEHTIEVADSIKGLELSYDQHAFESCEGYISNGKKVGIDW